MYHNNLEHFQNHLPRHIMLALLIGLGVTLSYAFIYDKILAGTILFVTAIAYAFYSIHHHHMRGVLNRHIAYEYVSMTVLAGIIILSVII